jgi:hypothetical protein
MCCSRLRRILCFSVLITFTGQFSHSQIWTGSGDGETWLDGSNWDAGIAPQVPGQTAIFDTNFGVPLVPIQIDGPIAISGITLLNAPGDVRIADDEPLHPFLIFTLDGGGASVPIKLDATPGYSLSFDESLAAIMFNSDVEVDHQGGAGDVFRIATPVFGGESLTFHPGSGRAELVASMQLDNLLIDLQAQLGDDNPDGTQDNLNMTGDLRIGPAGQVTSRAITHASGNLGVDGSLVVEPRGLATHNGNLVGAGRIELLDHGIVRIDGNAGLYTGPVDVRGGTLSVGGPFGGPAGQVRLHQFATIGTTNLAYYPAADPAVVVDPSVTTPGTIGLGIENVPGYALPIDLNFNNGVDNAYRLGSPNHSLSVISFGTPITPYDAGGNPPVYFLGGSGHLIIDTPLTDSPISGNPTALVMPIFPTTDFGVNLGAIHLNQFTSFTGPVRVEQEQLVLAHPFAVQSAASLDIVASGPQYDGGNYQHGTIVLVPALLLGGAYAGPRPQLQGGALGFAAPHSLAFLPTPTASLGPALFDASNFGGGSPTSSLLALGGGSQITQDPAFLISDALSPSGNRVVLITTDQAQVRLTMPNLHTGGTAVVGRSRLEINDGAQLGSGPLNIAHGATLHISSSTTIFNDLDLHDATAFGNSTIEVPPGVVAEFKGGMSTAAAPQGTFAKRGLGAMVFDPSVPWSPLGGENTWGLQLVEGVARLNQLPEYEPGPLNWQVGPLVSSGGSSLFVTAASVANAFNPANAGFRVLNAEGGSNMRIEIDAGAELKLAGVGAPNLLYGAIEKIGPGTLWLGGDSTGGDADGSHYTGRGDLNIVDGSVIVGGLPGTDDLARAFPDDVVLRIQDGAKLVKMQDQPGHVQSFYIGDASPVFGIADLTLLPSGTGLGDGSLNANIGPLGALHIRGVLIKDGSAPLRLSAQPGATITVFGGLNIIDGAIEVDASGIDPLTDTVSGVSMGVSTTGPGTLHVTAGTARVNGLGGTGRTRVEAGAKLDVAGAAGQHVYQINGEIVTTSFLFVNELLTGRGQVTGDAIIANGAALAPNDDSAFPTPTPATLTITGDLTMSIGSELNIDVDGATASADFVDIGGTADFDGTLTIDVNTPFGSLGTSSHLILSAGGGIANPFVVTPNPGDYLGAGVEFVSITYTAGGSAIVDLQQMAYADFDDDDDVDGDDLAIWQAGYGMTGVGIHSQGDADLDSDVDGRDFIIWQRQFGTTFTTLPSITPSIVPETTSAVLILITCTAMSCQRSTRRN